MNIVCGISGMWLHVGPFLFVSHAVESCGMHVVAHTCCTMNFWLCSPSKHVSPFYVGTFQCRIEMGMLL